MPTKSKDTTKESKLGTGRFPHPEMTDAEQEQRDYAVEFAENTTKEEVEAAKEALDSIVDQNERQTARAEEAQNYAPKVEKESGMSTPPLKADDKSK